MRFVHSVRSLIFAGAAALFALLGFAAHAQSWPPSPSVKMALNPVTNKVYVLNESTNSVTVIDAATNTTRTITVGGRPYYVAVNPTTNRIYVNNSQDATLTVIDGASDTVLATLPLGSTGPIQVNPITNVVYVVRLTGPSTDEVTYVNGATDSYYTIATQSFQPIAVAVNPVTNKIFAAHYATGDVRIISGAFSGIDHPTTVSVGVWSKPVAIVANPATNMAYVITEDPRGPIGVINGGNNTATFPAIAAGRGVGPRAIAINTVSNKVYAAFKNEIIVLDGNNNSVSYVPLPPTGDGPMEIGVNHATNKVYVATSNGTLAVLDGSSNALVTTFAVPAGAEALAVNPITNKVYVGVNATTVFDGVAGGPMGNPLNTSITPLAGNTSDANPSFTLNASTSFNPYSMPIRKVYYRLDNKTGAWQAASGNGPYTASFTGLAPGTHTLYAFATDGQDSTFYTSSSSAPLVGAIAAYTFTVGSAPPPKESSTVSLTSSLNPSNSGQAVTFTAVVSASSAPSGTVAFMDGSATIAGCASVTLAGGRASCTTSALSVGAHSITAQYSGSSTHSAATSGAISQTVKEDAPAVGASAMFYPANGATLEGKMQLFVWKPVKGAKYQLLAGSAVGGSDLDSQTTMLPGTLSSKLPTDGRKVYVRLITTVNGKSAHNDYVYTADSGNVAEMKSPKPLISRLDSSETFKWSAVSGAKYQLWVGRTLGGKESGVYPPAPTADNSLTVSRLPGSGAVFVRLFTIKNGTTQFRDYAYGTDSRMGADD